MSIEVEKWDDLFNQPKLVEPMTKLGDMLQSYAATWGKQVIDNAERAGVSDQSVAEMKERMVKWMAVVVVYQKEIREVSDDPKLDEGARARQEGGYRCVRAPACTASSGY